jgi:MFS family permease
MRALAEFVMRGRMQAIAVASFALVTLMFSWVAAAIVVLVTVSRGKNEGLLVAAWASLPALLIAWQGNPLPLLAVIGGYIGGYALGATRSWSVALLSQVVVSVAVASWLLITDSSFVAEVMKMQQQMVVTSLDQVDEKTRNQVLALLSDPVFITGALALNQMLFSVISLILGRWWQALLYNPGGFQQEFHQLRLSPQLAVLFTVLFMAIGAQGGSFGIWGLILVMPILLAGIALVHWLVSAKHWSKQLLVLFYIVLLLSIVSSLLIVQILVIAAIADSFLDLRSRLISNSGQND